MASYGYEHLVLHGKDIFVFLHTAESPQAEKWTQSIAAFKAVDEKNGHDLTKMAFFVVTDGGAPDAKSRADFNKFLNGRSLCNSVVTDAALVRGVVTAIGWFNSQMRAFSSQHVYRALDHVGLAGPDEAVIFSALRRIQTTVDPVRTLTAMFAASSTRRTG